VGRFPWVTNCLHQKQKARAVGRWSQLNFILPFSSRLASIASYPLQIALIQFPIFVHIMAGYGQPGPKNSGLGLKMLARHPDRAWVVRKVHLTIRPGPWPDGPMGIMGIWPGRAGFGPDFLASGFPRPGPRPSPIRRMARYSSHRFTRLQQTRSKDAVLVVMGGLAQSSQQGVQEEDHPLLPRMSDQLVCPRRWRPHCGGPNRRRVSSEAVQNLEDPVTFYQSFLGFPL
jgi:hypothetical protein